MRKEFKILGAIAILVLLGAGFGAYFYRGAADAERKPAATNANVSLVREDSPVLGPADAKVTIVEFLDPECESCAAFAPIIKKVLKEFEGKTRLVVRYMPLHPNSMRAANFTEAAGEEGKYWQAQELLFAKQGEWGEKHGHGAAAAPKPDYDALFEKYAMELGLNLENVKAAMKNNKYGTKIERDRKDGTNLGVRQTPTLFVNGRKLNGLNETALRALIVDEMNK